MLHARHFVLASMLSVLACAPKEPPAPPSPQPVVVKPRPPLPAPEPETPCDYLVLIDAGNKSLRAFTYEVTTPESGGDVPVLKPVSNTRVEPGLGSEPAKAAESVKSLLQAEGGVLQVLPEVCRAKTPAVLMATGAMRLLEEEEGGEEAARQIYDAARAELATAGLDARFAGTISGRQEALYGWIGANYVLGRLTGDQPTVGVLDLGAVSTQIAFGAPEAAGAPTMSVHFGERTFVVYAHSYHGYGHEIADSARGRGAVDACYPRGLNKGTGKYAACAAKLEAVVRPKSCESGRCGLTQPGSEAQVGVAQPPIPDEMKFYALGGFYYLRALFKLPDDSTPTTLREAAGGPKGKGGFCGTPWARLQETYAEFPPKFLESVCFNAAWSDALLKTFGFAASSDALTFTDRADDQELGWALGAALCLATNCMQAPGAAAPPAASEQ
jgi:hypothetical protein